jgi:hypothetical protein
MGSPFVGSTSEHGRQKLRGKRFARVTRDIYVMLPGRVDVLTRLTAAQMLWPDSIGCLFTAAEITHLPVDLNEALHVARQPGLSRTKRAGIEVHRWPVRPDEVLTVKGVRVTGGPRTLADLAGFQGLEQLVAVGDEVLKRYSLADVEEAVVRAAGRPGVRLLRQAVPLLDNGSASPAESRSRLRLHAAGFTSLRHKVIVRDHDGGWVAELDLGDPLAKVGVQYEGKVHFEKGERQRIHDVDRDALSRLFGWQIVTATRKDDAHPDLLVQKVTHAYRVAALTRGAA